MYDYDRPAVEDGREGPRDHARLYFGSEIGQGYAGDEDNGEMSAWYAVHALGFYPLQVGTANWAVGSPKFEQVPGQAHAG